jgi:hypothetical protein
VARPVRPSDGHTGNYTREEAIAAIDKERTLPDVLEQDDFSSNHHPALMLCWSMIFSENRYPLFGIML